MPSISKYIKAQENSIYMLFGDRDETITLEVNEVDYHKRNIRRGMTGMER